MTVESDIGLAFWSASSLARLIRSRQISARELVELHLDRIRRLNPPINAIVTLHEEGATARAAEADELLSGGAFVAPPLAAVTATGRSFFFPIPFARHCKITLESASSATATYDIEYRTYPPETPVRSCGGHA